MVEVTHARPEKQVLLRLQVPAGSTVANVIEASGITREFPGLQVDPKRLGIFSQKTSLEAVVREGDRVEIYRPLIADPKESRRRRAARDAES